MVTGTVWYFIWTFCILSSCIWSPLPYETLCKFSAVYLHVFHVYAHLYSIKLYMNLMQFIFMDMGMVTITLSNFIWTFHILSWFMGHLYPIKLYMNLLRFIFMYMFPVTLWNFIWNFRILSLYIWSPLPCETIYEPFAFSLHVGHRYPIKLYLSLPHFIFMYMVTVTLWNCIWIFHILSL